jgi:hypothetical protein
MAQAVQHTHLALLGKRQLALKQNADLEDGQQLG